MYCTLMCSELPCSHNICKVKEWLCLSGGGMDTMIIFYDCRTTRVSERCNDLAMSTALMEGW
jgi:hypothetical protein